MFDWDDIRYFLAVARSGSTLAAARHLKVSQATVSRRVTMFEEALDVGLFVRSSAGYELSARGQSLLPQAEAVEAAVQAFADGVAAEARRVSGEVRLTTVESAATTWVVPALAGLHQRHPDVRVEIITSDDPLDLLRGEADVAIRFGTRPDQEMLVIRHLAELQMCLYASRRMVTDLGRPEWPADIARYPIVADSVDRTGLVKDWFAANVPDARIVHRANTLSGIVSGVRAGLGAAMLPSIMGDAIHGLVRLMPPVEELTVPCWLVTTELGRRQPHIRAVIDSVVEHIMSVARGLETNALEIEMRQKP